jgi:acetoin utilization protein AcuB
MLVKQVMTANPVSVEMMASLDQVERLLFDLDVRHLPVLEDGELRGIISDRDLERWRADGDRLRVRIRAEDIMSTNVVTVTPGTEVSAVINLMLDRKIGALPVVTAEGGRELVGIISYIDIQRTIRAEL